MRVRVLWDCLGVIEPPWPNGQGVGLLIRRLWVRVPQGVQLFYLSGLRPSVCLPISYFSDNGAVWLVDALDFAFHGRARGKYRWLQVP